jgi:AraC-like DNA-binding protein
MSDGLDEPGILTPAVSLQHFDYRRYPAGTALADLVDNFWTVSWDLAEHEPYTAQVLPNPSVNLSVTNTEADVTGLVRRRYDRHLVGRGYAVGARFRPGCFRPLIDFEVSALTDRHRPISEVLGRDTTRLRHDIAAEADTDGRVGLLTDFLAAARPAPDPVATQVAAVVAQVAQRRDITRVAQVAEIAGWTVRQLQRIFSDYVGAGPKWVIQRFRLQDAAVAAAAAERVDWAALAVELGFADQAHLTRAFTATIGLPPGAYATRAQPGPANSGVSNAVRTPVR